MLVFGSCGNKVFDLLSVCWVRGSGDYDQQKKRYSRLSGLCCCIVSVFGSGEKLAVFLLWREIFITTGKKDTVVSLAGARSITTGKKKIQLSVCWVRGSGDYDQFFCCGGKFLLRPEKKDTVVCLAGARSLLRPGKKDTVVCLLSRSLYLS